MVYDYAGSWKEWQELVQLLYKFEEVNTTNGVSYNIYLYHWFSYCISSHRYYQLLCALTMSWHGPKTRTCHLMLTLISLGLPLWHGGSPSNPSGGSPTMGLSTMTRLWMKIGAYSTRVERLVSTLSS